MFFIKNTFIEFAKKRTKLLRQEANLWNVKEKIWEGISSQVNSWLVIIDSIPIEVCKFVRAKRSRLFKETAEYGKWFGQTFYGYRLHIKINQIGMIKR